MTDRSTFKVHVLASGSRGNATVVTYGEKAILIDAGVSARRIVTGLAEHGLQPTQLQGVFITHEHSDHISGLPQMLKRFQLPVYTKRKTWDAMRDKVREYAHLLVPIERTSFDVGDLTVEPFSISHDAADPLGFSCYGGPEKATILTDTGQIDDIMLGHLDESTMVVLEANHDLELLRWGPYMPALKERVAGPKGHLKNEDAAEALLRMKRSPNLQVVLAHRSEQNNTIAHVTQSMKTILEREGLRIGKDITLMHGQPKECVSMYPKDGHL